MRVEAFGSSDIGLRRSRNEDRFLVDQQLGLYAVCDGMGGHAGGDVAAETVIETLAGYLRQRRAAIERLSDDARGQATATRLVAQAVRAAHQQVRELAAQQPELRGMGTTLTMLLVVGDWAITAHVGDSRLYHIRRGQAQRLTEDHTLAAQLSNQSAEDLQHLVQRFRHSLLKWIGSNEPPEPDLKLLRLRPGDCVLLCTDGLSIYPEAAEDLPEVVCHRSPEQAARTLVQRARDCGGRDNITAVVLRLRSDEPSEASTATLVMDQAPSTSPSSYCFSFR